MNGLTVDRWLLTAFRPLGQRPIVNRWLLTTFRRLGQRPSVNRWLLTTFRPLGQRPSVNRWLLTTFRRLGQRPTVNRQLLLALLILLSPHVASACTVCYGAPDSPMTKGSDNAVLFLLGVIGFVQVSFVGLFVTFWRRARTLRRRRESFRLLEGGHH